MLYFSLRLQELDAFKSIKISTLLHILTCQYKVFSLCPRLTLACKTGTASSPLHKWEQGDYGPISPVLREKPNALISLLSQKKGDYFAVEHYLPNGLGWLLISVRVLLKETIWSWAFHTCFKIILEMIESELKILSNCSKYRI